jgi:hypothetical protein
MSDSPRRGPTKRHLEQLITNTSRAEGTTAARMRRWVSAMVLLGALQRDQDLGPAFILKGGVVVELRLQAAARATQDVDVIFAGADGLLSPGAQLMALRKPHQRRPPAAAGPPPRAAAARAACLAPAR